MTGGAAARFAQRKYNHLPRAAQLDANADPARVARPSLALHRPSTGPRSVCLSVEYESESESEPEGKDVRLLTETHTHTHSLTHTHTHEGMQVTATKAIAAEMIHMRQSQGQAGAR